MREIEDDLALRLFGGCILLGMLVTFENWLSNAGMTAEEVRQNSAVCWPFFQSCQSWVWTHYLHSRYAPGVLYMCLFGVITLGSYALLVRRVLLAHACILALFAFKIYLTLTSFMHSGNFDYYHTIFCIVFLFLPRKRFFGSLMMVWCYFLSTATKIHPSWVWGSYFSSMRDGLPLTPKGMEPVFTNLVIFMEMIGSWFLFSSRKILQRGVFAFFVFFHLYSGTLVGYHYPTIVLPPLLVFFGPLFRPFPGAPLSLSSLPGWLLTAALLVVQMFSHTLPGDTKLTLEGNFYGLYMFEANHQCRVRFTAADKTVLDVHDRTNARDRCDPWLILTLAQQRYCPDYPPPITFAMIHSINGGPFYEIINEPDLCRLRYKPFEHNDWIKDETTAPIVGRPMTNYYR